jgi:hypothetical protein|tara:strand:+ start:226 stop:471 length:246 start_codon:yes stop_codon:yes gene_type:complete
LDSAVSPLKSRLRWYQMLEQAVVVALDPAIVKSARMTRRVHSVAVGAAEVLGGDVIAEEVAGWVSKDKSDNSIPLAMGLRR